MEALVRQAIHGDGVLFLDELDRSTLEWVLRQPTAPCQTKRVTGRSKNITSALMYCKWATHLRLYVNSNVTMLPKATTHIDVVRMTSSADNNMSNLLKLILNQMPHIKHLGIDCATIIFDPLGCEIDDKLDNCYITSLSLYEQTHNIVDSFYKTLIRLPSLQVLRCCYDDNQFYRETLATNLELDMYYAKPTDRPLLSPSVRSLSLVNADNQCNYDMAIALTTHRRKYFLWKALLFNRRFQCANAGHPFAASGYILAKLFISRMDCFDRFKDGNVNIDKL